MAQLTEYRQLIKRILSEHIERFRQANRPGVEEVQVFDEAHDEYLWLTTGWDERHRVRDLIVHVRLRENKFWIEEDWTEWGIATDLVEAGVPKEDIVLAFHPPDMRQYTEFAAA